MHTDLLMPVIMFISFSLLSIGAGCGILWGIFKWLDFLSNTKHFYLWVIVSIVVIIYMVGVLSVIGIPYILTII